MGVGETEAGFGDGVQVRRFHGRRAVAAEIAIADVVGKDYYDIRATGILAI